MQVLDAWFQKMSITPKIGGPLVETPKMSPADFEPYPEEFDYLARFLYQFGPKMSGYRLVDLNCHGWLPALIYILDHNSLDRGDRDGMTWMKLPLELMGKPMSEVATELGIRILVLGPDPEQVQLIDGLIGLDDDTITLPYAVIYHSYDNLWYPLEHLDTRPCNLCYEHKDLFLKDLLDEGLHLHSTQIDYHEIEETSGGSLDSDEDIQ